MRTYRACWMAAVVVTTGVSVVVASLVESPWLLLAEVVTIGTLGLAFGASWEEDPARRWASARVWGVRALVSAAWLTGLPPVVGAWSFVVLPGLGATHPAVVQAAESRLRGRRDTSGGGDLSGLSDEELARRWRSSSSAVGSSWRTPVEVLSIVQERQQLLDEMERRDPQGFSLWLVSRGWRQAQGG